MKLLFIYLFLVVALSVSSTGDILAKSWTSNRKPLLIVAALLLYTAASLLWIFWLQYEKLSVALIWWQSFGTILTLLISFFYFKERLSLRELIAMVLMVSGIVLLSFQGGNKQGSWFV